MKKNTSFLKKMREKVCRTKNYIYTWFVVIIFLTTFFMEKEDEKSKENCFCK